MLDITPNHMGYVKESTAYDTTSYKDAAAFKGLNPFNQTRHFHNCTRCSANSCGIAGVPDSPYTPSYDAGKGSRKYMEPFYEQLQQALAKSNNSMSIDGFTSTHCRLMNLPVSNKDHIITFHDMS